MCFPFLGHIRAREERGVGPHREGEVQQIYQKEHDGDRDAELPEPVRRRTRRGSEGSGGDQRDRREREHRRLGARPGRVVMLLRTA